MANILNLTDIACTKEGDFNLVGEESTDIGFKLGTAAVEQAIYLRLKTEVLGCKLWKDMGQELRSMFGKRITKTNCETIKELLKKALTFGGVFDIIKVEVIPIEGAAVYAHCQFLFENGMTYRFNFEYNFEDSLLNEFEFNIL